MTDAILVATIASAPPTLAALLAFATARGSQRAAADRRAGELAASLAALADGVGRLDGGLSRVEASVDRVTEVVVELRERVARLEGAPTARGA
jgi:X-X-X-Leu-X-X-Gly heptad repeat protein